jgi:hypothetical protein
VSRAPGKAISDFFGGPFDQIHAVAFITLARGCQAWRHTN